MIIKGEKINFIKDSTITKQIFNLNLDKDTELDMIWAEQISDIWKELGDKEDQVDVQNFIDTLLEFKDIFSDIPGKIKGYSCKLIVKEGVKFEKKLYPVAQSSNASERYLKEVGVLLRTFLFNKPHNSWYQYVEEIEFILNNTVNLSTGFKPVEIMFRTKVRDSLFDEIELPLDAENFNKPDYKEIFDAIHKKFKNKADKILQKTEKGRSKINYKVGDLVVIKNIVLSNKLKGVSKKLMPKYKGIYKIVEIGKKNYYKIIHLTKKNIKCTVNRNLLKPYIVADIAKLLKGKT